uniref:hypothetical protein n=1 Tax=Comamonas testosteroni TaxID=285 RepID=UPI0015F7D8A7|nr:hypothetical protein [Comamonas testosteroni]
MDLTPLEHAAIAVGVQLLIGMCMGNWWLGGLLGCCWFAAREHTQAEYRWIEAFANGRRAGMPWWGGFDPRAWNVGSLLDFAVPIVVCVVVWIFIKERRGM